MSRLRCPSFAGASLWRLSAAAAREGVGKFGRRGAICGMNFRQPLVQQAADIQANSVGALHRALPPVPDVLKRSETFGNADCHGAA